MSEETHALEGSAEMLASLNAPSTLARKVEG
jgi:hypothetical protein